MNACRRLAAALMLCAGAARADVAVEAVGETVSLTQLKDTWFWANDPLLKKVSLTDYEADRTVGTVDGGWMITTPLFPHRGNAEFYVPETHYSRGSRGERIDVLTFYDTRTLAPTGEAILPGKRAHNTLPAGNAAISDDDRFIAIFNMVPAQSLSIVDVQQRKFVTEIDTPGCALVYGAGPRRFMMMCGNGALMFVWLNDDGTLREIQRNERQFDPQRDPVREYGVRVRDTWYFVSFAGEVYSVDVSQPSPAFANPWPLPTAGDRADRWHVGGRESIAIHAASRRLYALVHQGETDTHKQGGTHVWIHDLDSHRRLATVKLKSPGFSFTGEPVTFGKRWDWLYDWLTTLAMRDPQARPDLIAVTQGASPALLVSGEFTGMVGVYDALTMEFRRRVGTGNLTNMNLIPASWNKEAAP
jgi:methylamine dehydrogenase heavy chain